MGDPAKVAMDKSAANKAAIGTVNAGRNVPIFTKSNTLTTSLSKAIALSSQ